MQFDGVLENVSQESVYTSCTHEVVDGLLAGYNGTVFCYGQVWQLVKKGTSCCACSHAELVLSEHSAHELLLPATHGPE